MSRHQAKHPEPDARDSGADELAALFGTPDEQLCSRCAASYPLPGDTLCSACRLEVDVVYGDLPGADDA